MTKTKTPPTAPSSSSETSQPEGVRETIDSIVIALILAFVFRAFIIEAFVIPTGSMASTLNGAHGTMICQNCGWEYTYGLTDASVRPGMGMAITEKSVSLCRNCRYPNHTVETNDARGNYEGGDRILVLKWPFDIGGDLLGPQRWNVIVFKDPSDGATNYIKRLAGLPNEVFEIVDGDVYAVPTGDVSEQSHATLDAMRHIKYLRRTGSPPYDCDRMESELAQSYRAVLDELDTKLRIRQKTSHAQKDLWRTVYDHDYPPRQHGADQPAWRPDSFADTWKVGARTLEFDGIDSESQSVRLFAKIDSFCAYNALPTASASRQPFRQNVPVSDLRIRYVVDYRGGDGSITAQLVKRNDVFAGELQADGVVRIRRRRLDGSDEWRTVCETNVGQLTKGRGRKTEFGFSILDYRVSLAFGGSEVLATSSEDYAPDVAELRRSPILQTVAPAISAAGLDVVLSHVVVESDIYYLSMNRPNMARLGLRTWGTQNNPILLREGEYFMLGDNSAQSKDSRLWDEVGDHLLVRGEGYQLGTVPADQLIGRAFFVYWPSGLRTSLLPFLRDKGWIPNIGHARWIR